MYLENPISGYYSGIAYTGRNLPNTNIPSLLPFSSKTSSGMPFDVLDCSHNGLCLQILSLHYRLLCQSTRHLISFHLTMSLVVVSTYPTH